MDTFACEKKEALLCFHAYSCLVFLSLLVQGFDTHIVTRVVGTIEAILLQS